MSYRCSGCEKEFKRIPKRIYPFSNSINGKKVVFCVCRKCYKKFPFGAYRSYRKHVVYTLYNEGRINKDNEHGQRTATADGNVYLTTLIVIPLVCRNQGLVTDGQYERELV